VGGTAIACAEYAAAGRSINNCFGHTVLWRVYGWRGRWDGYQRD
jgi:hypothetical protein